MPIKWSAVEVSEAMDGVERQINLAELACPPKRSPVLMLDWN